MIRINLLPVRAARKKESIRQQLSIAGLSILLLSVVIGLFYFSINREIQEFKGSISVQEKEISMLDKEIGEVKNIEAQKKVVMEKLNMVKQLEVNKRAHLKILSYIAGTIPERAWIESFKESGKMLVIAGFAATDDVVADFMRALEKSLMAWKVELEVVEQKEKEKIKLAGFTIRLEKP